MSITFAKRLTPLGHSSIATPGVVIGKLRQRHIYTSFVRPQLEYASTVWGPVAVLGKNIGGGWPLIIWEATTAKQNYYRTKWWCIAKNLGGYTLKTRCRAVSAERTRMEAPRGVGFLERGVPLPSRLRGVGERRELPLPTGVRGKAPAANAF